MIWTRRSLRSRARSPSASPSTKAVLINRRAALRTAYTQFVFLLGGADHEQMERMRKYLSELCRGWNVHQVREIVAETLHELIDPIIYDEAASLIEEHHAAGRDVVIVSTSGAEVVEPIGGLLGADRVVATRMVVKDDVFTGEVEYYAYGPTKAEAVRELAASEGYDLAGCYAYSDSATDIPMLESVGHPHAVNPDRALRREAAARDWPVLAFNRPVRLKQRVAALPMPSRPALLTAAAVGAVAAAVGLFWLASRRSPANHSE
ncbi:HAD family hydrolase [Streptomyces thioluteus]|uniref:HAD family hydrolase n=1 Tax=Streptomyces thioluteus TaxID=66431 RepID=UPI0031E6F0BA